jgi:hypothetical protein
MAFTPIIGTLGYVLSPDRAAVLLVHRSRAGDVHAGKWNGLGGKLEAGEDVVACIKRELREGDRHWLPLVFGDGPVFHGVMPYVDGRPESWSYTEL